jgi:hypothetical protein
MNEFHKRMDKNIAHLKALFKVSPVVSKAVVCRHTRVFLHLSNRLATSR